MSLSVLFSLEFLLFRYRIQQNVASAPTHRNLGASKLNCSIQLGLFPMNIGSLRGLLTCHIG
jgi:hypothetical protein